ncbi:helix-turn-helix transcriptional regulator [Actinomadura sp. 9N407]|uniref:helix-turn-helix transcriptional regulator n=1 Tax=Actinomadura sp. 9N407 TaxID=3375154 RepID=UPI0037A89DA1
MVRQSPDPTSSIYDFMGYYLRFLRMQHGATQVEVGKIIGCSNSQVSKYESGEKQLDVKQCESLDKEWNTGDLFTTLLVYAKHGADANLPARLGRYQRRAVEHHIFSNLIPFPLQTEAYAKVLLQAGHAAGYVDDVEVAVSRRMDLQAAVMEGRPNIWVVVDQVALRPMGAPEVMAAQRDRLLELGALAHVSIRILPLSAAPHIGLDGSFWCFTLPNRRQAAFSGSALGVGRIFDDQTEAARVAERFQRLAARAWSEDQSREHLEGMGVDHDGLA